MVGLSLLAGAASPASGQVPPLLESFDFETPISRHRLAPSLREISGLAAVGTRLLAHNDEDGVIVELDPETGDVVKWIYLGPDRVRGDFEGIASGPGNTIYLVTSGGTVVTLEEGADGERVPFRSVATPLADVCEVEGLTETTGPELLVACKTNHERRLKDGLQVFAFDPQSQTLAERPLVQLDRPALRSIGIDRLRPSGIAQTPDDHLLVLSAQGRLIVELDERRRPVAWTELDSGRHRQPEGIALTEDGDLWIADEGGRGRARLTRYGPRENDG